MVVYTSHGLCTNVVLLILNGFLDVLFTFYNDTNLFQVKDEWIGHAGLLDVH